MTTNTTRPNLSAALFAAAALTSAIPSATLAREEVPTERVPYGDLDLTSEAGIATLDRRLDRAVRRVCGTATLSSVRSQGFISRCRKDTMARIADQRGYAIAHATQVRAQWAESTPRSQSMVLRPE